MAENISDALIITAIGMGLVFAAIILLWGVMAALVKVTASVKENQIDKEEEQAVLERQRRAAIIAVVIAMARQADSMEPHEFPLPPTAIVSAWQAVMRTRMHSKQRLSK